MTRGGKIVARYLDRELRRAGKVRVYVTRRQLRRLRKIEAQQKARAGK